MAIVWLFLGAALVLLVTSFGVQNTEAVDIRFFDYFLPATPLWLVLLIPALAGLVIGFAMGLPARVRWGLTHRRLNAQIAERDKTISALEQRVTGLDHELAVARRPAPVPVEEPRDVRDVPDGTRRHDVHVDAA
jgi:uncharacterized integral membrane protein